MSDSEGLEFIKRKMSNFCQYLGSVVSKHAENASLIQRHVQLLTTCVSFNPMVCVDWLKANVKGKSADEVYQRMNQEYHFLDEECKPQLMKYIDLFIDVSKAL